LNIQNISNEAPLDQLQQLLLQGLREDASKFAAGHNMWVEAVIIASQVNTKVYGEVVAQYLKQRNGNDQKPSYSNHPALQILFSLFGGVDGVQLMQSFSSDPNFAESIITNWNLVLGLIVLNRTASDTTFLQLFSKILFDANYIGPGQLWYM
jgi:hypothetical protein